MEPGCVFGRGQGVENGLHDFDLRQIRAMVLAMAKPKEVLFAHTGVGTRREHKGSNLVLYIF
jgi:hypothetical protein